MKAIGPGRLAPTWPQVPLPMSPPNFPIHPSLYPISTSVPNRCSPPLHTGRVRRKKMGQAGGCRPDPISPSPMSPQEHTPTHPSRCRISTSVPNTPTSDHRPRPRRGISVRITPTRWARPADADLARSPSPMSPNRKPTPSHPSSCCTSTSVPHPTPPPIVRASGEARPASDPLPRTGPPRLRPTPAGGG